jgi:hypothetical protein
MKGLRKEVAELLRSGKQGNARIRVEAVMREQRMLQAFEILELYLELLAVRAELLAKNKEIPPDMAEVGRGRGSMWGKRQSWPVAGMYASAAPRLLLSHNVWVLARPPSDWPPSSCTAAGHLQPDLRGGAGGNGPGRDCGGVQDAGVQIRVGPGAAVPGCDAGPACLTREGEQGQGEDGVAG